MSRATAGWLAVGLALLAPGEAGAARTLTWSSPTNELPPGVSEGMARTLRGRLFLGPRITPLGGSQTPEGPSQVWSMARDDSGKVYLGTGPEGQIFEIGRSGEPKLHFVVDAPMVTALVVGEDGALYAGIAPGGVIYRIEGPGEGEPWAATDERYVWSLVFGEDGALYAGTGERGRILRIDAEGEASEHCDTRESHIVSLEADPQGGLLAGGAGLGLVYRIDAEGHALVLHDDGLPEVVGLAVGADGEVVAATVGPEEAPRRRPTLRLRLPDGTGVGATEETLGSLEESSGPTLHGSIEGLPAPPEEPERVRGRVVRIGADGDVTELWSSTVESPFCLARDFEGRVLFGTGEPARLYRIEPDDDVALLATLREAQLTSLLTSGRSVVLAASNPAAAYRLHPTATESGTYESRPIDAGGPARWGRIRWRAAEVADDAARTELYTRTGNSGQPDATWSAWSPALTDPDAGSIVNPDGRFLQWRVRMVAGAEAGGRVESVSVDYEPYNRAPRLVGFELEPQGETTGDDGTRFRWSAADPDGDPIEIDLEYRPLGATAWARSGSPVVVDAAGRPAGGVAKGELVWDTTAVAEGVYEVRGTATDVTANPAGEGFVTAGTEVLTLVVDRTPPEITLLDRGARVARIRVEDRLSAIRVLELREDGRARNTVRSEDGVCDSPSETFRVELGESGTGEWSVRGIDAAGNTAELVVPLAGAADPPR